MVVKEPFLALSLIRPQRRRSFLSLSARTLWSARLDNPLVPGFSFSLFRAFDMLFPFHLVIFVLSYLFFCIDSICAASTLHKRQNDSKTVTTVQVINTPQGPMTQTCVIILTPITDSSGKPAVKEVQRCDLAPGVPQSSASSTPDSPVPTSSSPPNPTSSPPAASPVTKTLPTSDILTNTDTAPTTATGLPPSSASNASASQASSSAGAKFEIPGKNLSVLPIGLGVIAGVLVIALIVVGLVTYERTKYRKAFRQRKLAEMGADMGYDGKGS
ncbi:hypothetical protein JOM56_002431 [Amanita muscaria]